MAKQLIDQFPNRALVGITMSAANTISFEQIRFGIGLFQGVALILHRVEYYPDLTSIRECVAVADEMQVALTARDDLTSLYPTIQNVISCIQIVPLMVGAVVSLTLEGLPIVHDFTGMPGGGMIIPANPLFLAMDSTGFAGAGISRVILYFTFKSLADKDYLELLQTMVPANI